MEKFIINTEATYLKNILIIDQNLKVSDEDYKTKDAFLEKLNAPKKGVLDTQHVIDYSKITKIRPFEEENGIQLFFVEKEKKEKTYVVLNSLEEYNEMLQFITYKTNHLSLETTENIPTASWIKQAGYTLIALALTAAAVFTANDIGNNKTIEITGGKRGIKRIMVSIAETLGTLNSILIGSVIIIGLAFWTYKNYKKGSESITFYK